MRITINARRQRLAVLTGDMLRVYDLSTGDARVIAGSADQGSGAVLLFDVVAATGSSLPMETLPEPSPSPGLDDAPYFGVFSRDGARAALSNESWGGRGVFVYDVAQKRPLWSV